MHPFAGRVQTRNVEPGDLVQPSKILLEIARSDGFDRDGAASDGLEVVVALDEKNFAPLKLQQPVQLIADAWLSKQYLAWSALLPLRWIATAAPLMCISACWPMTVRNAMHFYKV